MAKKRWRMAENLDGMLSAARGVAAPHSRATRISVPRMSRTDTQTQEARRAPVQPSAFKLARARVTKVRASAADAAGFRYRIVGEDGSDYIRSHVFRETLKSESEMWASGAPDRAGFTPENYLFEDRGPRADGLAWLIVKPRRNDMLLVDGSIFLDPHDGDLVRLEGRLSKSPSFWARHIDIIRSYRRFAGVRMPVRLETVASVLIAGKSTFRMTYEYESINGKRVGQPQLRARADSSSR